MLPYSAMWCQLENEYFESDFGGMTKKICKALAAILINSNILNLAIAVYEVMKYLKTKYKTKTTEKC